MRGENRDRAARRVVRRAAGGGAAGTGGSGDLSGALSDVRGVVGVVPMTPTVPVRSPAAHRVRGGSRRTPGVVAARWELPPPV
ncbi:hypothetical protein GCM10023085_48000 [Actinomadura viridis]